MGNGWDYGFWHAYHWGARVRFGFRDIVCFPTGFWQEWSKWAWVNTSVKAYSLLLLLSSEDTKTGLGQGRD